MIIQQTKLFAKQKKKLHKNQIQTLDETVRAVMHDPKIGELKKGDLGSVRVYKFKMTTQQCLLAYQFIKPERVILLALGSHENFYRNLKRTMK